MKLFYKIVLTFLCYLSVGQCLVAQKDFTKTVLLMGSRFDITVVANTQSEATPFIEMAVDEISRIEKLISSWDPNSQTSLINKNAGIAPVTVDKELFDLILRCLVISEITDGAFDISYASMDRIWSFDGSMKVMPSASKILNSVRNVGYKNIILNKKTQQVFLSKKGMKIGFGGIGKGYAADLTKELLKSKGVKAGIINAAGDMNTWGKQANGNPWIVAITNPMDKNKAFATLPISNKAVVTSGNYEKFVLLKGKRYTHIINPKTGMPSSGIISVTVFSDKAELADALATAVFVMGVEVGMDRINQIPSVECILIKDNGEIITSKHIKINKT
ncbi:MAG: thiamine biosynthesis protein ApbE [Flavobacteriaceae bacterium]|nr:MAG: thiamine biosynthesis protein ApbE [Flavobacteriaceae bacterium]